MLRIYFGILFQIYSVKSINAGRLNKTFAVPGLRRKQPPEPSNLSEKSTSKVLGKIADGKDMRMEVRSMIGGNLHPAVHWYPY